MDRPLRICLWLAFGITEPVRFAVVHSRPDRFPALNLIAAGLLAPDFLARLPAWGRLLSLLSLTVVTDTGSLGEEFGWRGFALPRLLKASTPARRGPHPRRDLVGL